MDQYYWTNAPQRPTTTVGTLTSVGLAGGIETNGFTDFDPDTQVVFYGLDNVSSQGLALTPGQRNIFQGETGHNARGFTLQSTGIVTQDNYAPFNVTTILTRFSKANLGGGGAGLRAYLEFDGTASNMTDELNASNSFNVSSITDNSAGNYTLAFTNPVNNPIISVASQQGIYIDYGISYEILNSNQIKLKIEKGLDSSPYPQVADHSHISLIVF